MLKELVKEEIITECVEAAMAEGCHMDSIEDYDTPLEFYLSDMVGNQDQEYRWSLQEAYGITEDESQEIQTEIIKLIESKCNE